MPPKHLCATVGAALILCAPLASAHAEPETLYLTVGADAAGALAASLGPRAQLLADTNGAASAILVPADALEHATRFMHDQFGRCGGFFVHSSEADARAALEAPIFRSPAARDPAHLFLDNPTVANVLVGAIKPEVIRSTIELLSTQFNNRYFRTPDGVRSALALQRRWREAAIGRDDIRVELVYHSDWPQPSVMMTITGSESPDEVVVLGAHLDSTVGGAAQPNTDAPGADDDASGIGVLTAVAGSLLDAKFTPARTVVFIGYAAEEVGLRGSSEIAQSFAAKNTNVLGVLQFDMVLYDDSDFAISLIDDFTDPDLTAFLGELIDAYLGVPWTMTSCGYACSDHAAWTERGYPAAYPFESANGFNRTIHTPGDRLDVANTSIDHAAHFARLGAAFVAELGKGELTAKAAGGTLPPSPERIDRFPATVATGADSAHGPIALEPGTNLLVATYGDSGDVDLYIRFDGTPTKDVFDCSSTRSTSNETCFVRVPDDASAIEILVHGFEGADYELEVQYSEPGSNPDPDPDPDPNPDPDPDPDPNSGGCGVSSGGSSPLAVLLLVAALVAFRRRRA